MPSRIRRLCWMELADQHNASSTVVGSKCKFALSGISGEQKFSKFIFSTSTEVKRSQLNQSTLIWKTKSRSAFYSIHFSVLLILPSSDSIVLVTSFSFFENWINTFWGVENSETISGIQCRWSFHFMIRTLISTDLHNSISSGELLEPRFEYEEYRKWWSFRNA